MTDPSVPVTPVVQDASPHAPEAATDEKGRSGTLAAGVLSDVQGTHHRGCMFQARLQAYPLLQKCLTTMKQAVVSSKKVDVLVVQKGMRFVASNKDLSIMAYTFLSSGAFMEYMFKAIQMTNGVVKDKSLSSISFQEFIDFFNALNDKTATEIILYDNLSECSLVAEPVLTSDTQFRSMMRSFESSEVTPRTFQQTRGRFMLQVPMDCIATNLKNWTNNPWIRFIYRPKKAELQISGYNDLRVATDSIIDLKPEQIVTHPEASQGLSDVAEDYSIETTIRGADLKAVRQLGKLSTTLLLMWEQDSPLTVRVNIDPSAESATMNSHLEIRIQGYKRNIRTVAPRSSASASGLPQQADKLEHTAVPIYTTHANAAVSQLESDPASSSLAASAAAANAALAAMTSSTHERREGESIDDAGSVQAASGRKKRKRASESGETEGKTSASKRGRPRKSDSSKSVTGKSGKTKSKKNSAPKRASAEEEEPAADANEGVDERPLKRARVDNGEEERAYDQEEVARDVAEDEEAALIGESDPTD